MAIEAKLLQPIKAWNPIFSTLLIFTEANFAQFSKTPRLVPISQSPSKFLIELPIKTEVKLVQLQKVPDPMDNTEFGMLTISKPEEENAPCPILVTELGMSIEVNPVQPPNAVLPMCVTDFGI